MKIKSLLIGMLASIALVGCTNDDELFVENGQQDNKYATNYVSVKLIMTESNGSRATGTNDGGYNTGEPVEQAIDIDKSIFLFYDEAGNYVTSGSLVAKELDKNETGSHGHGVTLDGTVTDINSIYGEAFIALSATNDEIDAITQVLTIVNYNNRNEYKNLPLKEALAKKTTDAADANLANGISGTGENRKGCFLMSTSVYHDGKDWQETTKTEGKIYETQSQAIKDPVKIYIERATAKIQVVKGDKATVESDGTWTFDVAPTAQEDQTADPNNTADIVVDNGTTAALTPVKVKVLGWTVNNYNTTTNVVKRYQTNWNTEVPYADWNNANDHRSYWALDTESEYLGSPTIKSITDHQAHLATKAFNDAITNKFGIMYCYEHAKAKGTDNVDEDRKAPIEFPNVTTVLVAGQVLLPTTTTGEGENATSTTTYSAQTLYKHNGVYYTEDGLKSVIKSYLRKYTNSTEEILGADNWKLAFTEKEEGKDFVFAITVTSTEANIYLNKVATTLEAVQKDVNEMYVVKEIPATDTTEAIKEIKTEVLTDGYCSYQIPIEHLSSTSKEPLYGVIRNHWYQLKINAVAHVGEPVGDPEKPLPEIPEKETAHYLAAEIHVLSWHVVNQDVTLE